MPTYGSTYFQQTFSQQSLLTAKLAHNSNYLHHSKAKQHIQQLQRFVAQQVAYMLVHNAKQMCVV
jgi:hypothetical protein